MTTFFLFLSTAAIFALFINGIWWVVSEFFLPSHSTPKFIYVSLIAGAALLISITGILVTKINEEVAERQALVDEKLDIEQEFKQLRWEYERLLERRDPQEDDKTYHELAERISDLEQAAREPENQRYESGTDQQRLNEQIDTLQRDLEQAQFENSRLKLENENLQAKLEKDDDRSQDFSAAFYSSREDHKAEAVDTGPETYSNCTELTKAYSSGVGADHPAYDPSMDRNNDGWACE